MGRPAKSIEVQSGNVNRDEINARRETENALKGNSKNIKPSFPISRNQKKIFGTIKSVYEKAGILGELDIYTLTEGAVVIDRLQQIEKMINDDPEKLTDRELCNTRKEYMQNFFRICNELSLSPQARAKMGILAAGKDAEKNDPILKIFGGGGG